MHYLDTIWRAENWGSDPYVSLCFENRHNSNCFFYAIFLESKNSGVSPEF